MRNITNKSFIIMPVYLLVLLCMCAGVRLLPDSHFIHEKKDLSLIVDNEKALVNRSLKFDWNEDVTIKMPDTIVELVIESKDTADGSIDVICSEESLILMSPVEANLKEIFEPINVSFIDGVLSIGDPPNEQRIKFGIFEPIRSNSQSHSLGSGYRYSYGVVTVKLPKGMALLNPEILENGL